MIDGPRVDRIEYDEGEPLNTMAALRRLPEVEARRELIAVRPDGSTYSLAFPADWDLGHVLSDGHTVGFDSAATE